MSFVSLTQRIAFWFVFVSLLPLLLVGYSLMHSFENELQESVARKISVIADKKEDQIDYYLRSLVHDLDVLIHEPTAQLAMHDFARAFSQGGVESDAYRQLDADYRDFFKRFVAAGDYYDLFLISPQGAVIYSQAHEADFATNLLTGPYRDTALAKVARNALNTLENSISDFEYYAPSGNKIAAFIALPIVNQGRIDGVLAIQIGSAHVFEVLTEETGLGHSGETVVARLEDPNTALVIAPLKADSDAALKLKIQLDQPPLAAAIRNALQGLRGSGITVDYRGVQVVAAWRYLPRMGWGMAVKMDAAEALAPVYRMRVFALTVMTLVLFVAILGALLLGRRIVSPLKNISRSAKDLACGKLEQRVPVVGEDELGQLAVSFNDMAESLQSSHANLELRVEQRTADLTLALKQEAEAQKALQHERDFAASLLNTAPMIVLLLDTQGVIEYVNPYFERLSGYRLDEIKGKDWFASCLPERDRDSIRSLFLEAVHDVPTRGNINPIVTRSGIELEIEWYSQAMFDAQGKVISVFAAGQDVTVRHFREQEIQRLASIVNYSPDFIGISDLEGHVQFVNEAGCRLVGIRNIAQCRDTLVTDYIAEAERQQFMPKIMAAVMEQGRWIGEADFQHFETGALLPMQLDIFRIDDPVSGQPINFGTVCRDMREQKTRDAALRLNEARLNEAQRIAMVGSWELNLLTGELFWTDEIFRLFEIDKDKFRATYEAFLEAIHPDDRDRVNQAYSASLENRMPYEITHRLRMGDGRIKWVQERCSSDFDEMGKPISSVGTVQDVTELKQAELALIQLNEELEQRVQQRTELLLQAKEDADRASNAKSEFLSRMSHELRTPMNAVLGFAQLLETEPENPLTSDQLDNIREIRHAGLHLLELINEVLDLARVETGRIELSLEPVDVCLLAKECIALLQPLTLGRSIEMTLDSDGSSAVQADRLRLRQILLNLLSNAVKYNREQGSVRISCRPAAEGRVRISVCDSGRGIAADALPRLFKPFERIESAYDGIEGAGIGLALTKYLVEAMDGGIGVDSVVGAGSTFWVELPAAEIKVYLPAAADASDAMQNTYVTTQTVLYIEDNPANLRLVQKIISTQTCLLLLDARTAEQGLEIAKAQHPDLILLDINLPGMDGFEALRRLQDDPVTADIPVIAVSANAMERDVKKGLAAGFIDYLTKPLDIQKLLTLLDTTLKTK